MSFCTKCGNQIKDDAKFCPSCGSPVTSDTAQQEQPQQNTNQQTQYQNNTQSNPQSNANYHQNPDGTYVFTGPVNEDGMYVSDVEKNKYLNICSYIGILFLIPLFAAKDSKYSRFHVNQGIILCICSVAYSVVKEIILAILRACLFSGWESYLYSLSPAYGFYSIVSIILNLASLAFAALAIYGIYNTCTGKVKELPVIGKFRILK